MSATVRVVNLPRDGADTPEMVARMSQMIRDLVPHNRAIGMDVDQVKDGEVWVSLLWDPKLVGNPVTGVLHARDALGCPETLTRSGSGSVNVTWDGTRWTSLESSMYGNSGVAGRYTLDYSPSDLVAGERVCLGTSCTPTSGGRVIGRSYDADGVLASVGDGLVNTNYAWSKRKAEASRSMNDCIQGSTCAPSRRASRCTISRPHASSGLAGRTIVIERSSCAAARQRSRVDAPSQSLA